MPPCVRATRLFFHQAAWQCQTMSCPLKCVFASALHLFCHALCCLLRSPVRCILLDSATLFEQTSWTSVSPVPPPLTRQASPVLDS
ncbi:hypothetical protein BDW02DRAFT_295089 [Decorospora gaudefroyi]|uniref:Uncharacterized protein n=1 Tax=Decorospora gaudefroyi TaxID=184978 RepID=A0A6A5KH62_9PLEO|nr:hypothetical protein BDW02DRAFT_295089 [Decorospora gaudefroyi]